MPHNGMICDFSVAKMTAGKKSSSDFKMIKEEPDVIEANGNCPTVLQRRHLIITITHPILEQNQVTYLSGEGIFSAFNIILKNTKAYGRTAWLCTECALAFLIQRVKVKFHEMFALYQILVKNSAVSGPKYCLHTRGCFGLPRNIPPQRYSSEIFCSNLFCSSGKDRKALSAF